MTLKIICMLIMSAGIIGNTFIQFKKILFEALLIDAIVISAIALMVFSA